MMNFFNKSPHHRALLIFGGIVIAFLIWERTTKHTTKGIDLLWAAILGAAGVEAVKAFGHIQGASTP